MARKSLIDRWIEKLEGSGKVDSEKLAQFVDQLKENYRDEAILIKHMEAEAHHLPYNHLTRDALNLAEAKKQHLRQLERLIVELGGTIDTREFESYNAEPSGQFTEILQRENELGERLIDQTIWLEGTGLAEYADVLLKLKNDHSDHREKIERLIMKINAAL
ncbi:hypothetical protein GWN26_08855 [Candidatus Saccharibacteria bacterium]|nr:hypothetical protein [Candidatus Saccharibacteria bacterium]NIV03912.1 hypothetical protein [Calditrichia bacterium]NIV72264.1 hypothetical protein [Calditrichia bacterium]NIV99231.1 hypothetical protein [Candidatus Saccharibacteria bacterium]NIW79759.1 hypothetical protein [Calditrichia bacterium]